MDIKGSYHLFEVQYDERMAEQRINEAIDQAIELLGRTRFSGNENVRTVLFELSSNLSLAVIALCLVYKHPSYGPEQEVRILVHGPGDRLGEIKHRERNGIIVPYVARAMRLKTPGAIARVLVGPAAHSEAVIGIQSLLARLGYPEVAVAQSALPYRRM